MPNRRYAEDLPRLKGEIVRRVASGVSLREVGRSPGMPCVATLRNWARADPLLGEALADARRRAAWRERFAFDEGKAAAFLARARVGETVNSLIGTEGMPSRGTYTFWMRTQVGFQADVFALRQRRDAGIGAHGRARRRDFDQALADRLIVALNRTFRAGWPGEVRLEAVLAADPELPCKPVLRRWRREEPQFDRVLKMMFAARRAVGPRVPELLVEDVVEHITMGGSFASYSRAPGGPSRTTLRRWFRRDAAFAEAVTQACEDREDWYHEQIICVAEVTPPGPVREMERAIGPLKRQMVRLRHRPGAVHRRRGCAV